MTIASCRSGGFAAIDHLLDLFGCLTTARSATTTTMSRFACRHEFNPEEGEDRKAALIITRPRREIQLKMAERIAALVVPGKGKSDFPKGRTGSCPLIHCLQLCVPCHRSLLSGSASSRKVETQPLDSKMNIPHCCLMREANT